MKEGNLAAELRIVSLDEERIAATKKGPKESLSCCIEAPHDGRRRLTEKSYMLKNGEGKYEGFSENIFE